MIALAGKRSDQRVSHHRKKDEHRADRGPDAASGAILEPAVKDRVEREQQSLERKCSREDLGGWIDRAEIRAVVDQADPTLHDGKDRSDPSTGMRIAAPGRCKRGERQRVGGYSRRPDILIVGREDLEELLSRKRQYSAGT